MKKERPIIFNTEMVRAILSENKTQTRRIVKGNPKGIFKHTQYINEVPFAFFMSDTVDHLIKQPYRVGDILYVRETFSKVEEDKFIYKACENHDSMCWTPSIHMPKKAARIWLKVTSVKIERLKYISEGDAASEGVSKYFNSDFYVRYGYKNDWCASAYASFAYLWQSIYGEKSWNENPYVWVIKFERMNFKFKS